MDKEQTQNKKLSLQCVEFNRKLNILKINNNKKVSLSLFLSVLPLLSLSVLPTPTYHLSGKLQHSSFTCLLLFILR